MKVYLILLTLFACVGESAAQTRKPVTVSEIATYIGADREQLLYAGAKNEGTITWYTSLAGDSYKAMARAFENKYPGVRVETYRAGGSELVVRMAEEVKARRPIFDALETTYDFMMVSRANHLTALQFTRPRYLSRRSQGKSRQRAYLLDHLSRVVYGFRL